MSDNLIKRLLNLDDIDAWQAAHCINDLECKDHDANAIKAAIPTAARAVLAELEGKE
jgi:hypothetical protein